MSKIAHLSTAIALVALSLVVGVTSVRGDSSTPLNYVNVNFAPITSTISYNYDFSTGAMTTSTASATVFSTMNVFQNSINADPPASTPNGYGTFVGTARPSKIDGENGAVLYEQSVCGSGYPTCFSDGTFTYGYMFLYTMRGSTLDQLTTLATQYNVQSGCFGGGSPRFSIVMSDNSEIHVYLGTYPSFADCPTSGWVSTGNLATDSAGLRWDASQICSGEFYATYSMAVACANLHGLTISTVLVGTDGGWSGTNAGNSNGQTFLFQNIQVNGVTRFP